MIPFSGSVGLWALGIECLEQLFCHLCSEQIPACACLAKNSNLYGFALG